MSVKPGREGRFMITSESSRSLRDEETKAVRGHRSPRRFAMPEARPSSARFWSAPALWRFGSEHARPAPVERSAGGDLARRRSSHDQATRQIRRAMVGP
jgi:hypothetical protein